MNDPRDFNEPISVLRDCEATLIPEGSSITLTKGTTVYVTQALGGSVTVNVNGNLARIPPHNLDAIGLDAEPTNTEDMTLTAPGCGMGPFLVDDVEEKLAQVPNVSEVAVELVFEPVWNQDMMSEAARLQTGLY